LPNRTSNSTKLETICNQTANENQKEQIKQIQKNPQQIACFVCVEQQIEQNDQLVKTFPMEYGKGEL